MVSAGCMFSFALRTVKDHVEVSTCMVSSTKDHTSDNPEGQAVTGGIRTIGSIELVENIRGEIRKHGA